MLLSQDPSDRQFVVRFFFLNRSEIRILGMAFWSIFITCSHSGITRMVVHAIARVLLFEAE